MSVLSYKYVSLSVLVWWAHTDQLMGIDGSTDEHSLLITWALSAHSIEWFLGTLCKKSIKSTSFIRKNRKEKNNLLKACQSHFFLLFYATINITTTQYVLIVNKLEWNHLLLKQIIHCNLALYHTPKSSWSLSPKERRTAMKREYQRGEKLFDKPNSPFTIGIELWPSKKNMASHFRSVSLCYRRKKFIMIDIKYCS